MIKIYLLLGRVLQVLRSQYNGTLLDLKINKTKSAITEVMTDIALWRSQQVTVLSLRQRTKCLQSDCVSSACTLALTGLKIGAVQTARFSLSKLIRSIRFAHDIWFRLAALAMDSGHTSLPTKRSHLVSSSGRPSLSLNRLSTFQRLCLVAILFLQKISGLSDLDRWNRHRNAG